MATTIKLKNSVTTTNAPSSLVQGEVAINITDKKVWVGNAATTPIQLLGAGASGTFGALTCTSLTNSGLTSGRVTYASTGGLLADSANFTFNGTTVTMANDASISGLTVGKGAGSVATNVVVGGNGSLGGGSQTGTNNTALGDRTLTANTSGSYNTATGQGAVYLNTTGSNNSGFGSGALQSNTTGANNTALGMTALYSNTTASNNTAVGYVSLYSNTTGASNTAFGHQALYTNTTGTLNVALGPSASYFNTTGSQNIAIGYEALKTNTTASNSIAIGFQAGFSNSTSAYNCFMGTQAGYSATGGYNTCIGGDSGGNFTTGTFNTFVGYGSGSAVTTGGKNSILGKYSGNQDGLDIRTASNYAVISDGDGNRLLSTYNGGTLALDGGAVPQSGTGITFPATQSASSDANTLDDYEEGTWTPQIEFGGGTTGITYADRSGRYVKVGRLITCQGRIDLSNKGSSTGGANLAGLPFTCDANSIGAGSVGFQSAIAPSDKQVMLTLDPNSAAMNIRYASGTGTAQSSNSDFTNSSILIFSITYLTN